MKAAKEPFKPILVAAPHLSIGAANHRNAKGELIDLAAILSVLVEPIYLQKISNATFDDFDIFLIWRKV